MNIERGHSKHSEKRAFDAPPARVLPPTYLRDTLGDQSITVRPHDPPTLGGTLGKRLEEILRADGAQAPKRVGD